MTISTLSISTGPYTGANNTDTYIYDFKVQIVAEIVVVETDLAGVETTLVEGTDFSVTGVGDSGGGNVVRTAGNLPTGFLWLISRLTVLKQLADFTAQGPFTPLSHENAFDKSMMVLQENNALATRAIRAPLADISPSMELPASADRAGEFPVFDALGNISTSPGSGGGDTSLRTDLASGLAAKGSILVGHLQGASAVVRTVQGRLRDRVHVFDFMTAAEQADIIARTALLDVLTASQNAVDEVSSAEAGGLFLPTGLYNHTGPLKHTVGHGFHMYGEGRGSRIQNNTTGNTLELGDDITAFADVKVDNLMLINSVAGGAAIYARKRSNLRLHHCTIQADGVAGFGVRLEECISGSCAFNTSQGTKGTAWHLSDGCNAFSVSYNRSDGNILAAAVGAFIENSVGVALVGNTLESYFGAAIYLSLASHGVIIHGNYFEDNARTGLVFTGDARTIKADIILNGATFPALNSGNTCEGVSVEGNSFRPPNANDIDASIYLIGSQGFSEKSNAVTLAYNSPAAFIKTKNDSAFYQNRKTELGNSHIAGANDKYFDVENINLTAAGSFDEDQWRDIILQPSVAPRFDALERINPQSYGIISSATTTLAATLSVERYKGRQCYDITRSGVGTSHIYGVTVLEAEHEDFYDDTLWLAYLEVRSVTNTPGFEMAVNMGTGLIFSGGGSAVTTSFLPRTIVFAPATLTDFTFGYRMTAGTGADVVKITRPVLCALGSLSSLKIKDVASIQTFDSADATPSVKGSKIFLTNATGVTITRFDNGQEGDEITLISQGATVYDTSTATRLIGSTVDITTAAGDVTLWVCEIGGTTTSVWRLKGFVDVSIDNSAGA